MNKKWKYGSKIFCKDGRSKPWQARITIGYSINGYPVYHILDSFEDELDCILCLRAYTNSPYDIFISKKKYDRISKFTNIPSKIYIGESQNKEKEHVDMSNWTFKEVYEEYAKVYYPTKEEIKTERETHQKAKGKFSMDKMYTRKGAFRSSKKLYDIPYRDLRTIDFQNIINSTPGAYKKMSRLKLLFSDLDDFAEQKDIISKTYAKHVKVENVEQVSVKRVPFTNEEIETIWKTEESLIRDIVLILAYTGMRVGELLFTFIKNIHLEEDYIVAGLKTENGKNRIIPIHHVIKPIILKYYDTNNEFLFMDGDKRLSYFSYRTLFIEYMNRLGFNHVTHELRHTVESELKRRNADKVSINLILGHKTGDTGDDVYSHKSIQELKETIELISYKERKLLYLISSQ